jgi:hypothetical protein
VEKGGFVGGPTPSRPPPHPPCRNAQPISYHFADVELKTMVEYYTTDSQGLHNDSKVSSASLDTRLTMRVAAGPRATQRMCGLGRIPEAQCHWVATSPRDRAGPPEGKGPGCIPVDVLDGGGLTFAPKRMKFVPRQIRLMRRAFHRVLPMRQELLLTCYSARR